MNNFTDKSYKIVWWNIGICPPLLQKKPGKRNLQDVINVLSKMYSKNTSFFGLCEISENELRDPSFISFLNEHSLTYAPFIKKDGKVVWDIAFVYDGSLFTLGETSYVRGNIHSNHKKIAAKIEGELLGVNIRFLLSHFPTLNFEDESEKIAMFNELFAHIKIKSNSIPYTISMGDYNFELCSNGLIESFARSREYAKKSNKLYNPFVRHIGEKYKVENRTQINGTIYHNNRWRFYDFITITKDFFLSQSKFNVNDFNSGIWDELFEHEGMKVDHLPVYITINRKENDGIS